MRKILFFVTILCATAIFSLSPRLMAAEKTFNVLASTFPIYLFTANVCANVPGVEVSLLVPASAGCPHDFALRPLDMRKLTMAQALVINGAGLEDFLAKPLKTAAPNLPIVDAGHGLPLLDGVEDHVNPHIFAAPMYAIPMVKRIADGLGSIDPQNAAQYAENSGVFIKSLEEISAKLGEVGKQAANRKIALEHDALAYLAVNAALEIVATFDHGASASQLAILEKELKAKSPAALAGDSQYSDKLLKTVSAETKIPFIMLNPCAGGPENPPLDYYQQVMTENLKILEAHFDK